MTEECITISAEIQESIADMRKGNHAVDRTMRDNAIYHRDLLMVKLSRMEAAYANLMECASAHKIDENRDDGITEIKSMVSRAQSEAMTDSLLQLKKQVRSNEERHEAANKTNDTLDQQPRLQEPVTTNRSRESSIAKKRPNGTIRYMYAMCNDGGRYCANEIGKIKATIDNIVLPEGETEWENIVREAGSAVANKMRNSRHEMPTTSLIKINIEKKSGEKETAQREKERAEASQKELTKLSQDMSQEEKKRMVCTVRRHNRAGATHVKR